MRKFWTHWHLICDLTKSINDNKLHKRLDLSSDDNNQKSTGCTMTNCTFTFRTSAEQYPFSENAEIKNILIYSSCDNKQSLTNELDHDVWSATSCTIELHFRHIKIDSIYDMEACIIWGSRWDLEPFEFEWKKALKICFVVGWRLYQCWEHMWTFGDGYVVLCVYIWVWYNLFGDMLIDFWKCNG